MDERRICVKSLIMLLLLSVGAHFHDGDGKEWNGAKTISVLAENTAISLNTFSTRAFQRRVNDLPRILKTFLSLVAIYALF